MPVISAKLIEKPRKLRCCDHVSCGLPIFGKQLRLYGYAETGDRPYVLFVHPEQPCCGESEKIEMAIG